MKFSIVRSNWIFNSRIIVKYYCFVVSFASLLIVLCVKLVYSLLFFVKWLMAIIFVYAESVLLIMRLFFLSECPVELLLFFNFSHLKYNKKNKYKGSLVPFCLWWIPCLRRKFIWFMKQCFDFLWQHTKPFWQDLAILLSFLIS